MSQVYDFDNDWIFYFNFFVWIKKDSSWIMQNFPEILEYYFKAVSPTATPNPCTEWLTKMDYFCLVQSSATFVSRAHLGKPMRTCRQYQEKMPLITVLLKTSSWIKEWQKDLTALKPLFLFSQTALTNKFQLLTKMNDLSY